MHIGFDLVFEQFDCMEDIVSDMTQGFYHKIDRVMLVAIKEWLTVGTACWGCDAAGAGGRATRASGWGAHSDRRVGGSRKSGARRGAKLVKRSGDA